MSFVLNFFHLILIFFITNLCTASVKKTIASSAEINLALSVKDIIPEFYTGHNQVLDYCQFIQQQWKNPKYDNDPDAIFSDQFEELIPFAIKIDQYIQGHPDNFVQGMESIKDAVLPALITEIQTGKASLNDLFLALYRFQAALTSSDIYISNFVDFDTLTENFVSDLLFQEQWRDKDKSIEIFLDLYKKKQKLISKYFDLDLSNENDLRLYHQLHRKLPLKIPVPVLGESYLGIRLLLDHLLDHSGLIAFSSFMGLKNADGAMCTPIQYSIHDFLHYVINVDCQRTPFKYAKQLMEKLLTKGKSVEQAIETAIKITVEKYNLFNNYMQDFLNYIDNKFKHLAYYHQKNLSLEKEQETYKKTIIGGFLIFHETSFCIEEALETPLLRKIVNKMSFHLQDLEINIEDFHDPNQKNSYYSAIFTQKKQYPSTSKVEGQEIMRHPGFVTLKRQKLNDSKFITFFCLTYDYFDNILKEYEGLLALLPGYRSYIEPNRKNSWRNIKFHLNSYLSTFYSELLGFGDQQTTNIEWIFNKDLYESQFEEIDEMATSPIEEMCLDLCEKS